VAATRRGGGRVIAVGTTVVRALEGAFECWGALRASAGETALRLGPGYRRRVVDGLLTGVHEPGESHFALLGAFAPPLLLAAAATQATLEGYRTHEFGDAMLVVPGALGAVRAASPGAAGDWPAAREGTALHTVQFAQHRFAEPGQRAGRPRSQGTLRA